MNAPQSLFRVMHFKTLTKVVQNFIEQKTGCIVQPAFFVSDDQQFNVSIMLSDDDRQKIAQNSQICLDNPYSVFSYFIQCLQFICGSEDLIYYAKDDLFYYMPVKDDDYEFGFARSGADARRCHTYQ